MKSILVLCALFLAIAPVTAIQVEGNVFTLTDEEMSECVSGGGCVFATKQQIFNAMKSVHDRAIMGCGKQT